MIQYTYAFDLERRDSEVFFVFPRFPEIISAVRGEFFESWDAEKVQSHAEDAVLTALQSIVLARDSIPDADDVARLKAQSFVRLSPLHAMKLELASVVARNCSSIADFARQIDKQDTAARRLLNLRHRSSIDEIEEALRIFGKQLVHTWETRQIAFSPVHVYEIV